MEMNNTSKKRINILDLLVLIVVIAAVLFSVYWLFFSNENTSEVNDTVRFTIEAKGNDAEFLNYVSEGQKVYNSTTQKELGTIVAIHETPSRILRENHEKQSVDFVEIPGKVDVVVEVEGKAKMEHPNITINETSLKIGKQIYTILGDTAVTTTIIGIDYDDILLQKKEDSK